MIVGQSLEPVYDTRSTVILAELLIAPILLAAVFFGAVFVGTVPPGTTLPWMGALLLIILANELFCVLSVARAFSFEAPRRAYVRLKAGIDRAFGGLLALLGLKIALT